MGQKIQLSESQLRNLIKESVKKALVKEWRELTASEKEWRDNEQKREDKKRAKENDDAVEKSKFAKKILAQKSDNESDGKSRTKGDDDKERMTRIRRPLGGKTGSLNEISSDMIGRARDKFIRKYGNNYNGEKTPGEMDSQLKTDRYNRKLHPKDNRPLSWHQADFDRAYEKAKMDENPEIIKKAQELVHKVEHWSLEEITERYDYYCGYGVIYGEAKDENGEWWSFRAGGNFDDGEIVDVDYDNDIEFESPNGFKGTI